MKGEKDLFKIFDDDGIEKMTLTGVPAGTIITYPQGSTTVDDGEFTYASDKSGDVVFTLHNFKYNVLDIPLKVGL